MSEKFCKDCKWYGKIGESSMCFHKRFGIDLVLGRNNHRYCHEERYAKNLEIGMFNHDRCGIEATFFEKKERV
jgi:hypothetical protein